MALNPKSIKILIFDLDDTLFDTSGQLIAPASLEAYQVMISAGLKASIEDCQKEREHVYSTNPRLKFFDHVVNKFGVEKSKSVGEIAALGFQAFHSRELKEQIYPFPETRPTLKSLGSLFEMHLVTLGSIETQKRKVEKLKISEFFKEIAYVDVNKTSSKKDSFLKIMNARSPESLVSIGNRMDLEIREAKELGMQTILMNHGEYIHLKPSTPSEVADAQITNLSQLIGLLT